MSLVTRPRCIRHIQCYDHSCRAKCNSVKVSFRGKVIPYPIIIAAASRLRKSELDVYVHQLVGSYAIVPGLGVVLVKRVSSRLGDIGAAIPTTYPVTP
jgi:hypothetical protein